MGKDVEGAVLSAAERLRTYVAKESEPPFRYVVHITFKIGGWKGVVQGVGATVDEAVSAAESWIAAERKRRNV